MEKQHNRGQEGAGMACVNMSANAGEEFMFRERLEGDKAISELFSTIYTQIDKNTDPVETPFIGECYMGHLRYSTTGKSGISYVHPVLRRNNYRENTLSLCGNFNLTNVENIFQHLAAQGQHPRRMSDTTILLEQMGHELDVENFDRANVGNGKNIENILRKNAPMWDGGFVMCGLTGSGDMFAVRDSWGIRSAFYYIDEEIVVVASERPVIQTAMHVKCEDITELEPGQAIVIGRNGDIFFPQVVDKKEDKWACSFERIYFSRGSDIDIYKERKHLGEKLADKVSAAIGGDLLNSVFSFIPNTAEIASIGLVEGMNGLLDKQKCEDISKLTAYDAKVIEEIISHRIRVEKVAIKDIKLRTFISENEERNKLANHVYDITYGTVVKGVDNLVVIDDSIVRGTTLRKSIISILMRLEPKKLVIVSSAPQIRYPDFYGIDMSDIGDLIAFKAAVELSGEEKLHEIYALCKAQQGSEATDTENHVAKLYAPYTDEQISAKIAELVTPKNTKAPVEIIYQDIPSLREVCPNHKGEWYFSGFYPTLGGRELLNKSFINFYERRFCVK